MKKTLLCTVKVPGYLSMNKWMYSILKLLPFSHALAFCPYDVTNTLRGSYLWPVTGAEDVINFPCVYGTVAGGHPARRNCSDRGVWIEVELSDCLTFSNSLLLNITNVCMFS